MMVFLGHMMDSQQQGEEMNMSMNNNNNNNGGKMSVSSTSNSNYLCWQSSRRWTPTTEQIKLLKELYYNGVKSPSAEQIRIICSRLRHYGKIEDKNVFYWFQNLRARERQKKRLTPTTSTSNDTLLPTATTPQFHDNSLNNNNNVIIDNGGLTWRQQDQQDVTTVHAKQPYTINNPGVSCSSSSNGLVSNGGQFMGNFGSGAVTKENKFRDCSISGGGYVFNNGGANHVNQWNGANGVYALNGGGTNYNPYAPAYSNFLDKISAIDEDPYIEQDRCYKAESPQIETLPLFPMHNENYDLDYDRNHNHDHDHGFYTFKPPSDGYDTGGYW